MLRASSHYYLKRSQICEMMGVDLMLDDSLDLWLIEANGRPMIEPISEKLKEPFVSIVNGMFEITIGLMRSRFKRIIVLINEMTIELKSYDSKKLLLESLADKRKKFQIAIRNRFEPEFEPTLETLHGWEKFIDGNKNGVARYFGLIEEECF